MTYLQNTSVLENQRCLDIANDLAQYLISLIPWKRQKAKSFLTFKGGTEMENAPKMS